VCGRLLGYKGVRQENCDLVRFAVVSAACLSRHPAAGRDGFRDPLPNGRETLQAVTLHGLCGSSERPIGIFSRKPCTRGNRAAASVGRMQIRPLAIAGAHQFYRGREVSEEFRHRPRSGARAKEADGVRPTPTAGQKAITTAIAILRSKPFTAVPVVAAA
jgi:hypothetical protein